LAAYTYLASPYSHHDPKVVIARYNAVLREAARRMESGEVVFCPIAHSHSIAEVMTSGRQFDHAFWMRQDFPMVAHAAKLVVYCLPGWDESRGVNEEVHLANRIGIPVEFHPCNEMIGGWEWK
jgi:hypothetical protein